MELKVSESQGGPRTVTPFLSVLHLGAIHFSTATFSRGNLFLPRAVRASEAQRGKTRNAAWSLLHCVCLARFGSRAAGRGAVAVN